MPNMAEVDIAPWGASWSWGLPLILLTVVIHVFGLAVINDGVVRVLRRTAKRRSFIPLFAIVMAVAVLLATTLHAIEAVAWAEAFYLLGAVPDNRSAMLYSLNAMTTYGHESVSLAQHSQMMGALGALNGMLLFGLTTAFLFAMIQEGLENPSPALTRLLAELSQGRAANAEAATSRVRLVVIRRSLRSLGEN